MNIPTARYNLWVWTVQSWRVSTTWESARAAKEYADDADYEDHFVCLQGSEADENMRANCTDRNAHRTLAL